MENEKKQNDTHDISEIEDAVPCEEGAASDEEKPGIAEILFDWIDTFSFAFLTVILIFTFIVRLVTVQGPSMEYTLHGGYTQYPGNDSRDHLLISHLFYTPKQGDIVVIQTPNPQFATPIIKRIIATENQEVYFDYENWLVYVDGKPLDEPYVNQVEGRMDSCHSYPDVSKENPIVIEPGKIFVMGDNRNSSADSRDARIGQVDVSDVVGRVLLRMFPLNKFGIVNPVIQGQGF